MAMTKSASVSIAFGILRRDLQIIQVGDTPDGGPTAQEAAQAALLAGLYSEVFTIPVSDYLSLGMAHRPAAPAPLPAMSAPPLNLSPHSGIAPENVVGGIHAPDEAEGESGAGARPMRQVEGTRLSGAPGEDPQEVQHQTTTLASGVSVVTAPDGKVVAAAGLPGSGSIGEGNIAVPARVRNSEDA